MTSGSPWSVKGIDPKAREIAKDLARRSGMTLGEWLNQMIFVDGSESGEADIAPPRAVSGMNPARPATESRPPRRGGDDLDRVLAALEDMSSRLEDSEERQAANAARFDAALADLRADQARVAERLKSADQAPGGGAVGKAETLRALEGALNKVAGHLQDGEARSREALTVIRNEMNQEVQRVADQMSQKVQAVENRSADAIAQVGAEVTRVASVVEQRLRRADDAQAESLEKLGAEIARITERLSERIAAAERRSAQAIDDVGEQMARVTDRIHQRQERSSSELADRMRQSEERTAKLLEEAREKIERRLGKLAAAADEEAPAVEAAAPASGFAARWRPVEPALEPEVPIFEETVFDEAAPGEPVLAEAAPVEASPDLAAHTFLEPPALAALVETDAAFAGADAQGEPEAFAAPAQGEAVAAPAEADLAAYLDPDSYLEDDAGLDAAPPVALGASAFDESLDEPEALRPSTRELIAAARAAARVNAEEPGYLASDLAEDSEPPVIFSSVSGAAQRKPRMSGAMRGVLLTGGAVASIGLAATGYVVMHPDMVASLTGAGAPGKPIPVGPASASVAQPAAQQALALTAPAAKPAAAADDTSDVKALFTEAAAKVDNGDASGVAPLRSAANLGYAPAQRRLGKLYEDGGAGVPKDEAEGRRWTQRAAANGDPRGMHNLGLDYYEGTGGVKNMAVAAQWFQRAAELGLRDSQYNLARFYEAGLGVKQDLPLAYKWYLIAGRAGDTEAAARGEALKMQLPAQTRASVEKAALAFSPEPAAAPVSMTAGLKSATPKQLALAQRALSKLGYYQGADDGAPSQTLGEAIQAYQRDRGIAANGALSPELVQTFANVSR
jgi:localization factor PodJL